MRSLFGLDELTANDIPEGKPCFALIFDFPYEKRISTGNKRFQAISLPYLPLLLGKDEAYELEIDINSLLRLGRAYGRRDQWIGKPILLEVKNREIQCYPMKTCKLRYNWRPIYSMQVWWLEFRAWICYHITKKDLRQPIDPESGTEDE